jgi:hypothetical protein
MSDRTTPLSSVSPGICPKGFGLPVIVFEIIEFMYVCMYVLYVTYNVFMCPFSQKYWDSKCCTNFLEVWGKIGN